MVWLTIGAVAAALPFVSGCASIVSGTNQSLTVETPGCAGASCKSTNDKGLCAVNASGSVVVNRTYGPLTVVCSKAGVADATAVIESSTKGMAFGNVLLGSLSPITVGVDMKIGAAYDYPNLIQVLLVCSK